MWKTAFKKFEEIWPASADHITSNSLKDVFHKFYLADSWILCPIYWRNWSNWRRSRVVIHCWLQACKTYFWRDGSCFIPNILKDGIGMKEAVELKYGSYKITYEWFHKVSRVKFSYINYINITHGQLSSYLLLDKQTQLQQLEKSL